MGDNQRGSSVAVSADAPIVLLKIFKIWDEICFVVVEI